MAIYRPLADVPLGVNTDAGLEEMRDIFTGVACEKLTVLLSLVDKAAIWPCAELPPLKSWVSESGRLVLIGDAAVRFSNLNTNERLLIFGLRSMLCSHMLTPAVTPPSRML